ncbi:MAG: hypothetical protein WBH50_03090, partial [Fuerstiella sp.]
MEALKNVVAIVDERPIIRSLHIIISQFSNMLYLADSDVLVLQSEWRASCFFRGASRFSVRVCGKSVIFRRLADCRFDNLARIGFARTPSM